MTPEAKQYLHHLHDTLILLGCNPHFATLASNPAIITEEDINDLRRYNCSLIDATKYKLVGINKTSIKVVQDE